MPARASMVKTEFFGKESAAVKSVGYFGDTLSPDGSRLVGFRAGKMVVLDTTTGRTLLTMPLPKARRDGLPALIDIRFNAAGDRAVVTFGTGTLYLLDVAEPKLLATHEHHEYARFSPDGKHIVSYPGDDRRKQPASVLVLDAKTGKAVGTVPVTGVVPEVTFSEGTVYVKSGDDGTKVIDLATARALRLQEGDHKLIAGGLFVDAEGKTVRLVDARTGAAGKVLSEAPGSIGGASADGRFVALHDSRSKVDEPHTRIVSVATGKEVAKLPLEKSVPPGPVRFSDDGTRVWVESGRGGAPTVRVLDTQTGKQLAELTKKELGGAVGNASLSPNGRIAYVQPANGDGGKLFELDGGRIVAAPPDIRQASYSPNGRWLVVGTKAGVDVIDTKNGKVTYTHPIAGEDNVTGLKFSADSGAVIVHHFDANGMTAAVIDLARGEALPIARTSGRIYSVGVAADGTVVGEGALGLFRVPRR